MAEEKKTTSRRGRKSKAANKSQEVEKTVEDQKSSEPEQVSSPEAAKEKQSSKPKASSSKSIEVGSIVLSGEKRLKVLSIKEGRAKLSLEENSDVFYNLKVKNLKLV